MRNARMRLRAWAAIALSCLLSFTRPTDARAQGTLVDSQEPQVATIGYFPSSPIRPLTWIDRLRGFGAVGTIECPRVDGGIWLGSGVIVTSRARTDIVLTAGHNFFAGPAGPRLKDCVFVTGNDRARITDVEIGSLANPHNGKTAEDFAGDWAVALLDTTLSRFHGSMGVIQFRPKEFAFELRGCEFQLVAYHVKVGGMGSSSNCGPLLTDSPAPIQHQFVLPHTCSAHFGSSGGPLICKRKGELLVAAFMFRQENKDDAVRPFELGRNANYARVVSREIEIAIRKLENIAKNDVYESDPP